VETCTVCGQRKEVEAFAFKNEALGRRRRTCKACMAEYGRGHYARNREAYIARNVANMRMRRRALKERVWRYPAEHPCVDCGECDLVVLEFDHCDASLKVAEIYWLVQSTYGWARIEAGSPSARCGAPTAIGDGRAPSLDGPRRRRRQSMKDVRRGDAHSGRHDQNQERHGTQRSTRVRARRAVR
jgi:hypothetical protein